MRTGFLPNFHRSSSSAPGSDHSTGSKAQAAEDTSQGVTVMCAAFQVPNPDPEDRAEYMCRSIPGKMPLPCSDHFGKDPKEKRLFGTGQDQTRKPSLSGVTKPHRSFLARVG